MSSEIRDYIPQQHLQQVLAQAMSAGADFAEVFVEDKQSSSVALDDNRVESLSSSTDRGAGIRVIYGETTGFSHTSDLSLDGLLSAAKLASELSLIHI